MTVGNQNIPEIVALVPMRHASERVPGKNFRPLAGRPLYAYIISTLLAVPEISKIVVDTDSEIIMQGLAADFPQVQVLERPVDLRAGEISMNTILLHDIEQVPGKYYLQTHSTNPLLKASTISRGIKAYLEGQPEYDSLFSVTRVQTRFYDQDAQPVNHNPAELLRTQDLPPLFEENSCLYMFSHETLLKFNHRIGLHPLMFEIDASEASDIDTELDFNIVEGLVRLSHPG
jgi:CMP-N-acetylneuraminic acid synthetase